jgi:hypothetical protein
MVASLALAQAYSIAGIEAGLQSHTRTYPNTHTFTCSRAHTHVRAHTYKQTHTYSCAHTRAHTRTHTQTQTITHAPLHNTPNVLRWRQRSQRPATRLSQMRSATGSGPFLSGALRPVGLRHPLPLPACVCVCVCVCDAQTFNEHLAALEKSPLFSPSTPLSWTKLAGDNEKHHQAARTPPHRLPLFYFWWTRLDRLLLIVRCEK